MSRSSTNPGTGSRTLRLGTRRSALAMAQSGWVAARIEAAAAAAGEPVRVELVEVSTHGDLSDAPLTSFGGAGVFVSRLREELLAGSVDLAVHSLKDLPTAPADGLLLAAVPEREDPRDVLVARDGLTLAELAEAAGGAVIGTGSPRRAAQLRALYPGLQVVGLRGNVDTRMGRVGTDLDAVVLAHAGLRRLGRAGAVSEVLEAERMTPAPGQGALAIECRSAAGDARVARLLGRLDDLPTRLAVLAERSLLAALEAGCSAPLGALARLTGDRLSLDATLAAVDGSRLMRRSASVDLPPDDPAQALKAADALGVMLAAEMLSDGAADLVGGGSEQSAGQRAEQSTVTTSSARDGAR